MRVLRNGTVVSRIATLLLLVLLLAIPMTQRAGTILAQDASPAAAPIATEATDGPQPTTEDIVTETPPVTDPATQGDPTAEPMMSATSAPISTGDDSFAPGPSPSPTDTAPIGGALDPSPTATGPAAPGTTSYAFDKSLYDVSIGGSFMSILTITVQGSISSRYVNVDR